MSKRDLVFWLAITLLFGIATAEFGFIYGKWERVIPSFDYDVMIAQHETRIKVLESDIKLAKDKLKIP